MSTGFFAGIKLGYACPNCRKLLEKPPDPHMPLCPEHRIAYHRVAFVVRPGDVPKETFLNMNVFDADQRNMMELLINSINQLQEDILNHIHSHSHGHTTTSAAAPGNEEE